MPRLFPALLPGLRELVTAFGTLLQFGVGARVVIAIGTQLKKLFEDETDGVALNFIECPADAVKSGNFNRERSGSRIVVIEQEPVSAMLNQRQMGGVAAVVAWVVGIPSVHHRRTAASNSSKPVNTRPVLPGGLLRSGCVLRRGRGVAGDQPKPGMPRTVFLALDSVLDSETTFAKFVYASRVLRYAE